MTRLRILSVLSLLIMLCAAVPAAAQGDVGIQHTDPVWHGIYFNNATLSPPASFEQADAAINFNWGSGSPRPGWLDADYFSVRWSRYIDVTPGRYRFTATSDDGVRVLVDGVRLIDRWYEHPAQTFTADIDLSAGHHLIVVEYFEATGGAQVQVDWALLSPTPTPQGWRGEYYPNPSLSGHPATTRTDPEINFDWGQGSPFPATFGNDNFSVRWTRQLTVQPGMYRFFVTADDGARLWVNNHLLVDQWRDQPATTVTGDIALTGSADVRLEYYERTGAAVIKLRWERMAAPPVPAPGSTYIVQRGDTLSAIARRFGTTVQAIVAANGLRGTTIYVGQRLVIPGSGPQPGPGPTRPEVVVEAGGSGYQQGGAAQGWNVDSSVGHGGAMIWTLNNQVQAPEYNWARWYPSLQAGRYEVFAYIPRRNATTRSATYWIAHADGYSSRVVNQLGHSDAWVSLGTYRFRGTQDDYVSLNDVTGERPLTTRVGFDAVKWVPR